MRQRIHKGINSVLPSSGRWFSVSGPGQASFSQSAIRPRSLSQPGFPEEARGSPPPSLTGLPVLVHQVTDVCTFHFHPAVLLHVVHCRQTGKSVESWSPRRGPADAVTSTATAAAHALKALVTGASVPLFWLGKPALCHPASPIPPNLNPPAPTPGTEGGTLISYY